VKFSVVIPTRNRDLIVPLNSLAAQRFGDFEIIVVDDCPDEPVTPLFQNQRVIRLSSRSERAIARTVGMREAKGEWICWLDSDDAYAAHYLWVLNRAIQEHSGAKCFNFGAVVHRGFTTSLRPTFRPKWLGDKHVEFRSGSIGSGSFAFHRSVLDEIEPLPQTRSPYKFHELAIDTHHLYPFPGKTLGNPWGDDWLFFYRLTRKFRSVPLGNCLYVQYVRGSIKW
jgi:glycosyltransferase involved in cell wall biosynthesis